MDDNKLNYSLLSDYDNSNEDKYEGFNYISKKKYYKKTSLIKYLTNEYSIMRILFMTLIYNPFIYLMFKEEYFYEMGITKFDRRKINIIHIIILLLFQSYIHLMIDDIYWGSILKFITMIYLVLNIYIFLKKFKNIN